MALSNLSKNIVFCVNHIRLLHNCISKQILSEIIPKKCNVSLHPCRTYSHILQKDLGIGLNLQCKSRPIQYSVLKLYQPFHEKFQKHMSCFAGRTNKNLYPSSESQLFSLGKVLVDQARFSSNSSGKSQKDKLQQRNKSLALYVLAGTVLVVGGSYAAVPLYQVFCQAIGLGGEVKKGHNIEKVEDMKRVTHRPLIIRFNADTAASMRWNFRPQQSEVKVSPGETALAFYSAMNPTDKPIVGVSTYNVVPFTAGQYFNKIQCFCFEEQRLNPHEQVDMPVFFYIDPEFAKDPLMENVDTITLSYTFFEAKEGFVMPQNPYAK